MHHRPGVFKLQYLWSAFYSIFNKLIDLDKNECHVTNQGTEMYVTKPPAI